MIKSSVVYRTLVGVCSKLKISPEGFLIFSKPPMKKKCKMVIFLRSNLPMFPKFRATAQNLYTFIMIAS